MGALLGSGAPRLASQEKETVLTATITRDHFSVDDLVAALTGPPQADDGSVLGPKDQLARATEEVDRRTAETFGRALIDSLCEDPADVRRLEALLILGLAHPHILGRYHVSLAQEGRRLCLLLENLGEGERARAFLELLAERLPEERELQQDLSSFMRRTGDVDELVDRCLQHADEAVSEGRPLDAISWLQEILLHDQSRRDVARMIRDLRYQEMEQQRRKRRRGRLALLLVVVSAALSGLFAREVEIRERYAGLPGVGGGDLVELEARLAGLDTLIADSHFWFGMFRAIDERGSLSRQRDLAAARAAEDQRRQQEAAQERLARAESLRLRAIDAVAAADYGRALEQYRAALTLAGPGWRHRERVLRDIEAVESVQGGRR